MLLLEQSVEKVTLTVNQETKNSLHWANYTALQWLLPVFSLDLGGCDMDMYIFFTRLTDSNYSGQEKIPMTGHVNNFFFNSRPTDWAK